MSKKKKIYDFENALERIVSIEWDDSQSTYGWRIAEKDDIPSKIKSIGILVSDTKTGITISTSISEGLRFVDKLTIPKVSIRKMRRLRID